VLDSLRLSDELNFRELFGRFGARGFTDRAQASARGTRALLDAALEGGANLGLENEEEAGGNGTGAV
jgi:hypothetical protein